MFSKALRFLEQKGADQVSRNHEEHHDSEIGVIAYVTRKVDCGEATRAAEVPRQDQSDRNGAQSIERRHPFAGSEQVRNRFWTRLCHAHHNNRFPKLETKAIPRPILAGSSSPISIFANNDETEWIPRRLSPQKSSS
jgi:hypothetical protein